MKRLRALAAQAALAALSMLLGSALTLDAVRQFGEPQTQVAQVAALHDVGPIAQLEGGAQPASAQSLGVLMQCLSAQGNPGVNGTVTSVTQNCVQAQGDTSGLSGVTLTFTAPTQRYAVGVTGTVTLP